MVGGYPSFVEKQENSNAWSQNFDRLLASDVMATDKLVEGLNYFKMIQNLKE